ncbi:hypothetical protein Fcan01_20862 [Folsomia candida]|uniref:C2H2-type domain-containing protein n=1 Tax=Folsomia candida TaxID=158441 RepID=A0A226DIR4_FOLCA|nr:hypothetical protein Fcan01_20862 [Folsomia candida]
MWRMYNNRERPSCDTCHRMFFNSAKLRQHIDTVHSTKKRRRLPCTVPGCEKTFLHKGNVVRHVRTDHAQNPVRYPCTLCGKEFKLRCHLENHILTHTTEKHYKCATCGKSFAQMGHLKDHEKTHLDKSARDMSNCHVCHENFLSKLGLQRHIRVVHENWRNYPCTFCDKRFSCSSHLKDHVEARHVTNKELIRSCDKCEYKSYSKHNLANHRKRHNAANHRTTFLAGVYGIEEKVARETPYLRIMLTQDDGDTIMVAMAIGKSYHVAKNRYEVGNVYCFPRGMFEIRQRNVAIQSRSSYPFDLRFLNNSDKNESLKSHLPKRVINLAELLLMLTRTATGGEEAQGMTWVKRCSGFVYLEKLEKVRDQSKVQSLVGNVPGDTP